MIEIVNVYITDEELGNYNQFINGTTPVLHHGVEYYIMGRMSRSDGLHEIQLYRAFDNAKITPTNEQQKLFDFMISKIDSITLEKTNHYNKIEKTLLERALSGEVMDRIILEEAYKDLSSHAEHLHKIKLQGIDENRDSLDYLLKRCGEITKLIIKMSKEK